VSRCAKGGGRNRGQPAVHGRAGCVRPAPAGSPFALTNAVSHWLWATKRQAQELSWLHGRRLCHIPSGVGLATLYSRLYGHRETAKELPQVIAGGVATSAARLVDYTPCPSA
jgi:hypothetical protein